MQRSATAARCLLTKFTRPVNSGQFHSTSLFGSRYSMGNHNGNRFFSGGAWTPGDGEWENLTETEKLRSNPSLYSSPMTEGDIDGESLIDDAWIKEPRQHKGTLIWLHGIGETPDQSQKMFELLAPKDLRIIIPKAPMLPISAMEEKEERAWYDLEGLRLSDELDEDYRGVADSARKIEELLDTECARIAPGRVLLAGFAQGGAMAIHLGLSYRHKLAGILCCSGYVVLPEQYPDCVQEANLSIPILAIHGNSDEVVPMKFAKRRFSVLTSMKVPFELREDFHLTHQPSQEVMFQMQRWAELALNLKD